MEIVNGGYRNVLIADNAGFSDCIEVGQLLKRGTSIVHSTDVEESSDGKPISAEKKSLAIFSSADNDAAIFDALKSFEESQTSVFVRFNLLQPNYYYLLRAGELITKRDFSEAGKFNAIVVSAFGVAQYESELYDLVYLFNPFNPEGV